MAAFLAMYVEDRRNIYQKIFLAITFFSIRWLTVAMAGRLDDLVTKALVFRNMSAEKYGCNTDYMLEPEFWILYFVLLLLRLQ